MLYIIFGGLQVSPCKIQASAYGATIDVELCNVKTTGASRHATEQTSPRTNFPASDRQKPILAQSHRIFMSVLGKLHYTKRELAEGKLPARVPLGP